MFTVINNIQYVLVYYMSCNILVIKIIKHLFWNTIIISRSLNDEAASTLEEEGSSGSVQVL